jgi:hypothetical protein
MFQMSYEAGESLKELLNKSNTPDYAAFRLLVVNFDIKLSIDMARPGDTKFDHSWQTVLFVDKKTLDLLSDIQLVIETDGDDSALVIAEQVA